MAAEGETGISATSSTSASESPVESSSTTTSSSTSETTTRSTRERSSSAVPSQAAAGATPETTTAAPIEAPSTTAPAPTPSEQTQAAPTPEQPTTQSQQEVAAPSQTSTEEAPVTSASTRALPSSSPSTVPTSSASPTESSRTQSSASSAAGKATSSGGSQTGAHITTLGNGPVSSMTGNSGGTALAGSAGKSKTNVGAIAGGVVGGVVALILAIILAVCLLRRKRSKRHDSWQAEKYDPRGGSYYKESAQMEANKEVDGSPSANSHGPLNPYPISPATTTSNTRSPTGEMTGIGAAAATAAVAAPAAGMAAAAHGSHPHANHDSYQGNYDEFAPYYASGNYDFNQRQSLLASQQEQMDYNQGQYGDPYATHALGGHEYENRGGLGPAELGALAFAGNTDHHNDEEVHLSPTAASSFSQHASPHPNGSTPSLAQRGGFDASKLSLDSDEERLADAGTGGRSPGGGGSSAGHTSSLNNSYSSQRASPVVGFQPRAARQSDSFSYDTGKSSFDTARERRSSESFRPGDRDSGEWHNDTPSYYGGNVGQAQ